MLHCSLYDLVAYRAVRPQLSEIDWNGASDGDLKTATTDGNHNEEQVIMKFLNEAKERYGAKSAAYIR
jgi:hypothetical protein